MSSLQIKSTERLGYRPWLDGLRGIAIFLVFVHHLQHFIYKGGPLFGWLFLPFGNLGVDVFFVLSGFLITTLLLEEHQGTNQIGLKHFYIRRGLRLLPALTVFLLSMIVYSRLLLSSHEANWTARLSTIALFYCTNWVFAFGGQGSDLLGHLWSLAVEEQFYLIWPLALSLLLRWRLSEIRLYWLLLGAAILVCAHRVMMVSPDVPSIRIYVGSDTRADSLLIGCAIAMAASSGWLAKRRELKWVGIIAALMIAVYVLDLFGVAGNTFYTVGFTVFAGAVGAFILQLRCGPPSGFMKVLEWPLLVQIGKLSYSLYLWHFFTIGITLQMPMPNYVRVAVSIPLSLGVAACSYYLIEKPFLKLKSRYTSDAVLTHTEPEANINVRDQHGPIDGLLGTENT